MVNDIWGGSGVTDFSPEFGTAAQGYESVGSPLFLGLDPLLAALLVLLLVVIGAVAWWFGRIEGAKDGPDKAPAEIHKVVLEASQSALAAPSNLIHQRAQALRAVIDTLLGPVIVVANGLGSAVKKLDEALKGEVKDESPAKPAAQVHTAAQPSGCTCGHEAKPGACTCGGAPAAAAASALAFNHVTVIGVGPHPAPLPPAPPAAADKPKTRKLSHEEQVEALAKAVRAFHDHWSQSEVRIRELKAARAALSKVPPKPPAHKSGHEAHGGGHGEHGSKRVWDR